MIKDLHTERLRLRALTLDDDDFILRLTNTPEWIQFIGDRGIKTAEDARTYLLGGPIHNYVVSGFGFQLVELKETGEGIGMCGLVKRDTLKHMDLGFAFFKEFEGKGYAYEAARASMEFAKNELKVSTLQAICNKDNSRSITLLARLGFEKTGEMTMPTETVPLFVFETQL